MSLSTTPAPLARVLVIGNFASAWGGSRGVCEDLAQRLEARGHQVLTASRQPSAPRRLLDMTGTAWRHRRDYDVAQMDVFSGRAFFWAESCARVLAAAKKPFVLSLHGGNLPVFARRHPARVRRLLRAAHTVTAPSEYLRSQMKAYRGDIRLLPNALDIAHYPFRLREHPAPRLVWLRAFDHGYNPQMAVQTVARLAPEFPDLHLTMIGPDKGDGSLQAAQALAAELGVAERIEFAGRVPKTEVPQWLNRGDAFLNTTNVDNTPVSVTEAMACGLPVVSTDVGGIPYLLSHEVDALLVPPGDADAMAAAVARVLAEEDCAARLAQNARRKVEAFDWPLVLAQWEEVLAQAAQHASRARVS